MPALSVCLIISIGGSGELSHYDRVDQTTPDYPADVFMAANFNPNNNEATYNYNNVLGPLK